MNQHGSSSKKNKVKVPTSSSSTSIIMISSSSSSLSASQHPNNSNSAAKLVQILEAFQVKVETVHAELIRQNQMMMTTTSDEAADDIISKFKQNHISHNERFFKWLTKMNDYLRNLCSGFRARLLGPMSALPEMKQKQETPLDKWTTGHNNGQVIDLHRIYHSLNCAVIHVPELLLITHHLFASNQMFCKSLSELLSISERELWHSQAPALTQEDINCVDYLPQKLIKAVSHLLHVTRISGDWLRQHRDDQDYNNNNSKPAAAAAAAATSIISVETARLQRLLTCQKLLKEKVELVENEISTLELELNTATSNMTPLMELQEKLEDATQRALGIEESIGGVSRRIKAIETEILISDYDNTTKQAPVAAVSEPQKTMAVVKLPPLLISSDRHHHQQNIIETTTTAEPTTTTTTCLTLSTVCHREIAAAKKKLYLLDYLKNVALQDVEETCMLMPFIVRQTDYMQTLVDRLEGSVDEKRTTRLHLRDALAFISQETECAIQLCGQVELNGFTAALGGASFNGATFTLASVDLTQHHEPAFTTTSSSSNTTTTTSNTQDHHKAAVVYIKRRNHSQLSQQNSSGY